MAKILYVVNDFNMCGQHASSISQLKLHGVDFYKLSPGDIVVMINRKKTILRLVAALPEKESFGFLGTYKSPHGAVPLDAIQFISQVLDSKGFDMNKAIRLSLEKTLGVKGEQGKRLR